MYFLWLLGAPIYWIFTVGYMLIISLCECPISACVCTNIGHQAPLPVETGWLGYPATTDANYAGLCNLACNLGFCPSKTCSRGPQPPFIPAHSPFSKPACTAGTGHGTLWRPCSFSCNWGFRPIHSHRCPATAYLNVPPSPAGSGFSLIGDDSGLSLVPAAVSIIQEDL